MANIARNVSGNKLNKNAYIAMLALENYGYTGDYTLTSMYRSAELNKSVGGKKDSLHLHGNAIDIGVQKGDDQALIKFIKTRAGKKWLKDFNIYYEDETDKPGAPHHHFGFEDVPDTSKIENYNNYEEAYKENKNSDDEYVTIDTDNVDSSLKWNIVSTDINLPYTQKELKKGDLPGLLPEVAIKETKEELASDYQTQVYDTTDKKWYTVKVDYNDDNTDYEVRIYDKSGKEIDNKSKDKKERDIYHSIKKQVIDDNISGENKFKKEEVDDGNQYYTSHKGSGKYQITTPPIAKTNVPEVIVKTKKDESVKEKKKAEYNYRENILDRISGRKEYFKYLEENKDLIDKIKKLESNLPLLTQGSKQYNETLKTLNDARNKLKQKQVLGNDETVKLMQDLHAFELKNYVTAENNAREDLSRLQNEIKSYINNNEEVPQELQEQITKAREEILTNGNRVKLLVKQKNDIEAENTAYETKKDLAGPFPVTKQPNAWLSYNPSPVQKGYNQNILNTDGSINIQATEEAQTLSIKEAAATEEIVTEEVVEEVVADPLVEEDPLTRGQQLMKGGESLMKGAGKLLDYIGGPGAIISYIMGKKGLKEAMKEVRPQASAKLSPLFMQHLRQTRELSKKGFHPDETRLIRKEIDGAYQKGLENAVRGSGGQRATFLAQSGVLDSQRSSALLDFAAKDADLQRKNADKYEKMMLFKENFDIQRTEKERAEDMERQVANKKAAAGFTSAAFTNLISGFGGSSLTNQYSGGNQFFNQIQDVLNRSGQTGTENT